jgi:hypothetical protein
MSGEPPDMDSEALYTPWLLNLKKFPKKDIVLKAFNTVPFPDKYNDHTIDQKSFNPARF